jgi:diphthamide biosynthesis enzyme Dph1/Dph2-like protein
VLLQLPDGLKPWGLAISDYLKKETSVKISIWLGTCFGACDLPNSDADLVVQFGHAPW